YRNFDLLAGGGKEGVLYLLNAASLGEKDHHTPLITVKLANDEGAFQGKGIWGAAAVWRGTAGGAWLYVPIYGPVSKDAPQFPATHGATPHGSLMAFKVNIDKTTKLPILTPAWISRDFDLPDPPAVADGVVFVLSTGENPLQTTGAKVMYSGQTLLTTRQREAGTHSAILYALDAKTGKVLYQSGGVMDTWVHFSGLAIVDGQVYALDHDSNVYCFGLKKQQ
ncbi:MAG: PQQ-binding-like beta-propeller repeat protein, partial [Terriglobia bacterium]